MACRICGRGHDEVECDRLTIHRCPICREMHEPYAVCPQRTRLRYEMELDELEERVAGLTRERDEARAEVERLRAGLREVRRMALLVLRGHRCARCGVWDRPDDPRPELSAECHLRRACEEAEALLASAETEATDERE